MGPPGAQERCRGHDLLSASPRSRTWPAPQSPSSTTPNPTRTHGSTRCGCTAPDAETNKSAGGAPGGRTLNQRIKRSTLGRNARLASNDATRGAMNAHMTLGSPGRRSTPRSTPRLPSGPMTVTLRKPTAMETVQGVSSRHAKAFRFSVNRAVTLVSNSTPTPLAVSDSFARPAAGVDGSRELPGGGVREMRFLACPGRVGGGRFGAG